MIAGRVTADLEAVVPLKLRGPGGIEIDVEAVVDTGFTEFLCLPSTLISSLGLVWIFADQMFLADGSTLTVPAHECTVVWDGQLRVVPAHCLEGRPLIGMALLRQHLLSAEVLDNGAVTIASLP